MNRRLKRMFILAGGIAFLVLGVIGLVLPFLQGILFIAIGIILLSLVSPRIRTLLDTHSTRYPRVHKVIRDVEEWVKRVVGEH